MGSTAQARTLLLYALAFLGAHLAFLPLIVLLLPRRVEAIANSAASSTTGSIAASQAGTLLSWLLLAGGIAASISHIIGGYWSDRWIARYGSRRGLIAIGVAALAASYLAMSFAYTPAPLMAGFIAFQIALNLCFAPLGALLADYVPDENKGLIAGLMNAALPLSSLGIAAFAWAFPADDPVAFLAVAIIIAALIIPLLLNWNFGPVIERQEMVGDQTSDTSIIRDFALVWLSRFLIQVGATFVISYLYLYISNRAGSTSAWPDSNPSALVADASLIASLVAILAAVLIGRSSDIFGGRKIPMMLCSLLAGGTLTVLAGEPSWFTFAAAYGVFHLALTGFLAVDTALVAQLLAGNTRRGAWLGVMNLTNTLPAILVPAIALTVFSSQEPLDGLDAIFRYCAIGTMMASIAIMLIRRVK